MPDTNAASSVTIVFPGQGCQRPGMGRDFHERFRASREAYEEASDGAGLDLAALCFGEDERLGRTEFCQPAILATEIAMLRAIGEQWGVAGDLFGGHSLGEYAALVAAGVLRLSDAARIVRERGRLMQQAVPAGHGAMIALLGARLGRESIDALLDGTRACIANDNSDAQIVLSGPAEETRRVAARIAAEPTCAVERTVELDVSAPFHSWMMTGIEDEFAGMLADCRWDGGSASRATSNVTGGFHQDDTARLCERLVRQLSATVRWRDNMRSLASQPAMVIEVGPSRPLRAFFKTIDVEAQSVTDVRTAERALAPIARNSPSAASAGRPASATSAREQVAA